MASMECYQLIVFIIFYYDVSVSTVAGRSYETARSLYVKVNFLKALGLVGINPKLDNKWLTLTFCIIFKLMSFVWLYHFPVGRWNDFENSNCCNDC